MTTQLQVIPTLSAGGDLNTYMQSLGRIAILSASEEQKLAEDYYYREDVDAARQLVLSHLRFVVHIAKTFKGYGLPMADLIQEGNLGLMKAVKRFNPEKGVRLVSFAVHWIKAEMHEYVLRNWRIVKVATTKAQRKLFFNLRSSKKSLSWLNAEEAQAIANDLGVDVRDVQKMEGRLSAVDMAFDADNDDSDDSQYAPAHFLQDNSADPARMLENDNWEENATANLYSALEGLDERSRNILQQRWLNEDSKATLHELADEYGVSAERIRQLEKNAMEKVKAVLVV
jgi:RNA polymerase sigma-32 factor